jgi:preprotein translocase SecE subunit
MGIVNVVQNFWLKPGRNSWDTKRVLFTTFTFIHQTLSTYLLTMDRFANYLKATASEMKQVKWPTRRTAAFYSLLVIIISTLTALYAGAFDYLFGQFINYIVINF